MMEEECHRNFAFTMFHADHMPLLSFDWIDVERLGGSLWQIPLAMTRIATSFCCGGSIATSSRRSGFPCS